MGKMLTLVTSFEAIYQTSGSSLCGHKRLFKTFSPTQAAVHLKTCKQTLMYKICSFPFNQVSSSCQVQLIFIPCTIKWKP